jgi:hypothetical protein
MSRMKRKVDPPQNLWVCMTTGRNRCGDSAGESAELVAKREGNILYRDTVQVKQPRRSSSTKRNRQSEGTKCLHPDECRGMRRSVRFALFLHLVPHFVAHLVGYTSSTRLLDSGCAKNSCFTHRFCGRTSKVGYSEVTDGATIYPALSGLNTFPVRPQGVALSWYISPRWGFSDKV